MPSKNYITPGGIKRLKNEALYLIDTERPAIVKVVHWAASNGDRSENGDYIYGKKKLREIDKRIRLLTKKLDSAVVIDPAEREQTDQVFFGATVSFQKSQKDLETVSIVGVDEADAKKNLISWISPLAKALLKSRPGDRVYLETPGGNEALDVIDVLYQHIPID
ncbi:MAG: transcription elongation factor GreB [Betaproteobacteria bacterium]|jgi:transcription elongation factor GreB|nr:transcription elongation factor GreB [Betaproteobacteria bacterium]MDC1433266.1 transcription elongation factor GreB [Burkholderiales bacterium]MBT5670957.1 transcription elongation factor GreB [Betaproteobacteria bacterium]MBT6184069.1 transcription elongation factor GreB [Betaproteobacteria bacterium]MBT6529384.1 transcription elongation factor GreB [Betaproteobacteria bacterium]